MCSLLTHSYGVDFALDLHSAASAVVDVDYLFELSLVNYKIIISLLMFL